MNRTPSSVVKYVAKWRNQWSGRSSSSSASDEIQDVDLWQTPSHSRAPGPSAPSFNFLAPQFMFNDGGQDVIVPEKIVPIKNDIPMSWYVSGRLHLRSSKFYRNWIEVFDDLDEMTEHYRGSVQYKPLFLIIYNLLSMRLVSQGGGGGMNSIFLGNVEGRIHLSHLFPLAADPAINKISWDHHFGASPNRTFINFECEMRVTNRPSREIQSYVPERSGALEMPVTFRERLQEYGISVLSQDGKPVYSYTAQLK